MSFSVIFGVVGLSYLDVAESVLACIWPEIGSDGTASLSIFKELATLLLALSGDLPRITGLSTN